MRETLVNIWQSLPFRRRFARALATLGSGDRVSMQLYTLLAAQIDRYTMGDSSSVPEHIAQRLLASISFCIGAVLDSAHELSARPLRELFEEGRRRVWALTDEARRLYGDVCRTQPPVVSRALRDTLAGIGSFFSCYDIALFAHDIPASIDYQLCIAVPEDYEGVCYIGAYLSRLSREHELCAAFDPPTLAARLRAHSATWDDDIDSICWPLIASASACALLGGDPRSLSVSGGDRAALVGLLYPWTDKAAARFRAAAELMCVQLALTAETGAYVAEAAQAIGARLKAADPRHADRLFPML